MEEDYKPYIRVELIPGPAQLCVCQECGAIVHEATAELHTNWHSRPLSQPERPINT